MKIIKEGILMTYIRECPICTCVFEYDRRDTWESGSGMKLIRCPYCESNIEEYKLKKPRCNYNG